MGQILHSCATTTAAVRRTIQSSQESLITLAKRHGINPKTVAKWRKRDSTADRPMGPKQPHSTVLTADEEAICVALRKLSLLPLDDCLYTLQETIPHLTRSSLHRCFQRNGISQLAQVGDKTDPERKKFKEYPIGYFHIDIAEVQTQEGKLYLFVAIDRTSKFVYVEVLNRMTKMLAANFLKNLVEAVPYKIHTVLTDNGIQFTNREMDKLAGDHIFDRVCQENEIEHRLTKVKHPWTNGQVERMNRTIKDATVKRYHYGTESELKTHLETFVLAYNYAKRLKTLKGLTPYQYIVKIWQEEPERFQRNPHHDNLGLNNYPTLHDARIRTLKFGYAERDLTMTLDYSDSVVADDSQKETATRFTLRWFGVSHSELNVNGNMIYGVNFSRTGDRS